MTAAKIRIERDSIGEIAVPAEALWGAQTQRSIENFPIGGERMPPGLIRALALVKLAAARANEELGTLDAIRAQAIADAAQAIRDGKHDDSFPLVVWQTGSGTQTNMNMNEVIARLANKALADSLGQDAPKIHPNDHVNRSQSSNDSIPAAMHIAAAEEMTGRLLPALDRLAASLDAKAKEFADIVKIGRTHTQDATPLTLGQEFSAYVHQIRSGRAKVAECLPEILELAQGGTAVGTGLNSPTGFAEAFARQAARASGLTFLPMANPFAGLASHDPLVSLSGALERLASAAIKISIDIRLLASGPRSGLGEISLPANEPGSSIMPGKVNPTQCEALSMVACQIIGNHAAIVVANGHGHFELNAFKPVIAYNLLQSMRLLGDAAVSFAERCVDGIEADRKRIAELVERSLMLVTALAPAIGYDAAAAIAKKAHAKGQTLREAALESGLVDEAAFDRLVDPRRMLSPGQEG